MPPLNSRIWRRYGQLRIYVSAGDQPVGWCDPRTGRFQISQANRRDEFWAAIRAECGRLTLSGQIAGPVLPPEASAPTHQRLPADRPRHPARRPARHPARRPARHPARRPARHPARRPARHPARRPARHPARSPAACLPAQPARARPARARPARGRPGPQPPRRIGQRPGPGTAPRASAADRRGRTVRDSHASTVVRGGSPRRTHRRPAAQPVGRPLWLARPARSAGRPARR